MPRNRRFGPLDARGDEDDAVRMTVDEYETIRLIDLEGLTQEECAAQMNIARTTVQGIYDGARKTLAQCLVDGKTLLIGGGEYRLCDETDFDCGAPCRARRGCGRCARGEDGSNAARPDCGATTK